MGRPDISIVVKKHATGAELVTITLQNARYPAARLKSQIAMLGEFIKSAPRGIAIERYSIDANKPGLSFLRATFAVDGLVNMEAGTLKIAPFLKAFCGGERASRIRNFNILFDSYRPGTDTVREYSAGPVQGTAFVIENPPALEYRIVVDTADPSLVSFPDKVPERTQPVPPSQPAKGPPVLMWVAIGLAGLAAGFLVYSLLLRGGRN